MKIFLLFAAFVFTLHSSSQQPRLGVDTVQWFRKTANHSLHWLALTTVPAFPKQIFHNHYQTGAKSTVTE
jgi:hypothetical protein